MRIVFDPAFDRGGWPGPLGNGVGAKAAAVGEAWAGTISLRGHLEAALGLTGLFPSTPERIASLAASMREVEGFWTESAEKDPLGSARAILQWLDWLVAHGWEGKVPAGDDAPQRLGDLARLYPMTPLGGSDRLAAILHALDKRRADIESISSHEPIGRLLPLWQRIFAKLKAQGVKIDEVGNPQHAAPASSDLGKALREKFSPSGDGSLLLYRPYNPLNAAESVAVWLASLEDRSGVVIVSPDAALDEALRRFGLPALGAHEESNDDPWLQILPLVLAMGWNPPDPQRALELLLLPDGPVPGKIARRLRDALRQWPSVGSPDWDRALGEEMKAVEDAGRREALRERLEAIFKADAEIREEYPAAALHARAAMVRKWAAARRNVKPEPPDDLAAGLDAIILQCRIFERLVDLNGARGLSEPQLLKLTAQAAESVRSNRRFEAQAGLAAVDSPEAVAGPARVVVWWDFTHDAAREPFTLPLSRAELAGLEAVGVRLTPATELAADQVRRQRRPLLHAREMLLLVCPVFGEDGEERHPHPLWDEVLAGIGGDAELARIETRTLAPRTKARMRKDKRLPLPEARRTWTAAPKSVAVPGSHSPTALETLLGCPFKWTMQYAGKLSEPESAALADNTRLLGSLSHEILAEVMRCDPRDPEEAREKARELFDTLGPKLAAPLFLPGAPIQIAAARQATEDAARDLVAILRKAKLHVKQVEGWVKGKSGELDLNGRVDLLAGDPEVVVDLKWRGDRYFKDKLKNGTALQLAAYGKMLAGKGGIPPAAYFVISTQRLIAQEGAPFKGHDGIAGPPLEETWQAVEASTRERLKQIEDGRVEAAAVPVSAGASAGAGAEEGAEVVEEDALEGGKIRIAPPCRFCSFGFLCGIEWEAGR